MTTPAPAALLTRLEATRFSYGSGWPERKIDLLTQLDRAHLRTVAQVVRMHELLCVMRAYPDNVDVLVKTEKLLARFGRRADLASYKDRLADSGIAGTDIRYRFFWPTARWLAARWSDRLVIEWDQIDDQAALTAALPVLVTPIESSWLRVLKPSPKKALARLATNTTEATFFVRAVEAMPGNDFTREAFYDSVGLPLILRASRETPSRTMAHYSGVKVNFPTAAPIASRPNLRAELDRSPRTIRTVSSKEGSELIDLAREAMVCRGRDLDAFAYGDPNDVRLIDDGDGLAWAMMGIVPERRPILRAAYGYLILRNGVPVGYVQSDTLWKSVDLAFNTFATFRGIEAAVVLGRTMAMLRHLFDAASFTLEPYQLGDGNDEGLASGAWWFYYRLGFRPRNARVRALARAELERMKHKGGHRSSATTLATLAKDYLYFEWSGVRAPRWPRLAALGSEVGRGLSQQRAEAVGSAPHPLAKVADGELRRATPPELRAWASWTPIVSLMPGLEQWTDDEKLDLVKIILAKGGPRDTDYLRLFDRHPKLGDALREQTGA
ncbi:MAG: hypothetical protein ACRDVK_04815 [Acidimicrobiia bacterium]